MPKQWNIKFKLITVFLSLWLILGTIELGLRAMGIIPGDPMRTRLTSYEFDPQLGWVIRKNFKYYRATDDFAHYNYYGQEGFPRTKEQWRSPLGQKRKLALIGDSFVEGYYVEYDKSFANIIDLNFKDEDVLNLGVSGYSPDQYLLAARRTLPKYQNSRNIVFFYSYNDITEVQSNNYMGYAKPLFKHGRLTNVPLKKIEPQLNFFLSDYSALYYYFRPNFNKIGMYWEQKEVHSIERYQYSVQSIMYSLSFINRIDKEFGVELVVYIPHKIELGEFATFAVNQNHFLEACKAIGLNCFVPEMFFNEFAKSKFYYPNDSHFSANGSAQFAEDVIKKLSIN